MYLSLEVNRISKSKPSILSDTSKRENLSFSYKLFREKTRVLVISSLINPFVFRAVRPNIKNLDTITPRIGPRHTTVVKRTVPISLKLIFCKPYKKNNSRTAMNGCLGLIKVRKNKAPPSSNVTRVFL